MITIQPYIDRLEFLREVLEVWIDYWMDVPVLEEKNPITFKEYFKSKNQTTHKP